MCDECRQLEARIQRYYRIGHGLTVEQITALIQELRKRQSAMHDSAPISGGYNASPGLGNIARSEAPP